MNKQSQWNMFLTKDLIWDSKENAARKKEEHIVCAAWGHGCGSPITILTGS